MQNKPTLLLIDDEESVLESITGILTSDYFLLKKAYNGKEGLRFFTENQPDLVIADYKMPEMNGIEFIKAAKSIQPDIPIIILTAHGDKNLNLEFLKEGAFRYVEKPFDIEEFRLTIADGVEHSKLIRENKKLQDIILINEEFPEIIGESKAISNLFDIINKVANTDITILIQGESGTGKELVAKAIHEKSNIKNGPFIRFNCAALPETLIESELFGYERGSFTGAEQRKLGRFELAQNGTIFIDEIGELSPNMQVKLLRILQEKEFERVGGIQTIKSNARVLAATNQPLKELVDKKAFREDLFYRLNVFPIDIPPLRDRDKDIILIANHFLNAYAKKYNKIIDSFSPDALAKMQVYTWKGNIRELENVISRAVILSHSNIIDSNLLAIESSESNLNINFALQENWSEDELVKIYAKEALRKCNYNKKETCKYLGINYRTLIKRLQ